MLRNDIPLDELRDLKTESISEYCELQIDGPTLEAEVDEGRPFGRRELCAYLGIAESTLSGWLKENRVPRMAKEAFMLQAVIGVFQKEIARLRMDATDAKILKYGQVFQLCVFEQDEYGQVLGRVIADDIPSLEVARLHSVSHKSLRMLKDVLPVIEDMMIRAESKDYIDRLEGLRDTIRDQLLQVFNYDGWKAIIEARKAAVADLDLESADLKKPKSNTDTS